VINPPQATILRLAPAGAPGRPQRQDRDRKMMSVTLSCDHRAIDGALGAELIGASRLIENP
jgi:pyruvate dehydrogenase E2 component (dihydrolipoamide acetyltransferase)